MESKGGRAVESKGGRAVESKGGLGSNLYHRVVSDIGHRKQTFTSAKHRYDANRMKNVFHSRREMQVDKHRIKAYLMHSLSPTEKDVLDATSEYRHIYYKSQEEIVLEQKRRTIMNRVNHQYNKLLKSTFPSITGSSDSHLVSYQWRSWV